MYNNSQKIEESEYLIKRWKQCRVSIQSMLKQYRYQQNIPVQGNINKLCTCLQNVMNVQNLEQFVIFLSDQEHLPIQFNFKNIKYQYLNQIFYDWINYQDQHLITFQRTLSNRFRNGLFNKIFKDQQHVIKNYFNAFPQKQRVKNMNLFQLLTELFNPYYLYEYYTDNEQFFQKTTSFESFIKMIEQFINKSKRFYIKDSSDTNDENYIRLHEFQQVIQFWQNYNQQLTLQQQPRKNKCDKSIQVSQTHVFIQQSTQTQKQTTRSYLCFIHGTLYQVSKMLSKQNDPEILKSLNVLFQTLRLQKVFAITREEKQKGKYKSKKIQKRSSLIDTHNNDEQSSQAIGNQNLRLLSKKQSYGGASQLKKSLPKPKQNPNIKNPYQIPQDDDKLKTIYRYLCSKDEINNLNLSQLQIFFYNLGLVKAYQNYLVNNLIHYGFILNSNQISFRQFKCIVKQLMKQSNKINWLALQNYINNFQDGQTFNKTPNYQNSLIIQNNSTNNKSQLSRPNKHLLNKDTNNSYVTSKNAYLLDIQSQYI